MNRLSFPHLSLRPVLFLSLLVLLGLGVGCTYTVGSGLPDHIKTVEVQMFDNSTYYYGLESSLTREVIERMNLTPGIKVVNSGADATISGTIVDVKNYTTTVDRDDRPSSVTVSVTAVVTMEDNQTGEVLMNSSRLSSSRSSSTAGTFDVDKGEKRSSAQDAAVFELARVIARAATNTW